MEKKLLSQFDSLPKDKQQILLALSIVSVPIGQTKFLKLLTASNAVPKSVSRLIAKPLRDELEKLRLVVFTKRGEWVCAPGISQTLIRKAVKTPLFSALAQYVLTYPNDYPYQDQHLHDIKNLRIYLYRQDFKNFNYYLTQFKQQHPSYVLDTLKQLFFVSFDEKWFSSLPSAIRLHILITYQQLMIDTLGECDLPFSLMNTYFNEAPFTEKTRLYQYIELNLIRGNLQVEHLLKNDNAEVAQSLMGMVRFMQGRYNDAQTFFKAALALHKKETRKRKIALPGLAGYLFNLSLLHQQTTENLNLLRQLIKATPNEHKYSLASNRLLFGLDVYESKKSTQNDEHHLLHHAPNTPYNLLFQWLVLYWLDEYNTHHPNDRTHLNQLMQYCEQANNHGYNWFATVCSHLLKAYSQATPAMLNIANMHVNPEFDTILDLLPRQTTWQRALDALTRLGDPDVDSSTSPSPESALRMIWTLRLVDGKAFLTPREQRLGKSGRWTKGRPVAIKRLSEGLSEFDYLTPQDLQICKQFEIVYEDTYYSYHSKEIFRLSTKAIIAAIDHPNVYWEDAEHFDAPITISKSEIQLLVLDEGDQLLIRLSPTPTSKEPYILEPTATNDITVYVVSPQHQQVANILGDGLQIPRSAKQQVIDSISAIASMVTVQSDVSGLTSHAESVEADSRLHLHLQPIGEGLQIDTYIQPFTKGGPLYKPGIGGANVFADIEGKPVQTTRDLVQEMQFLETMQDSCPALYSVSDAKWLLDDADMALETLLQLQEMDDFSLLEWPKGKPIKISRETGLTQVQFSVRKEKDWFSVSGDIQIDDDRVLEMKNLMDLLAASPGRFLKLNDGQIIALTQELRQRLDDLTGLGDARGKKLHFHPLAAQALDDMTEGMSIQAGKHWKDQLKRLSEMNEFSPELPSTLQGELRDYQLEGYQWGMRLAYMGAGACLADDMGLGKTIQALAIILARAPDGPTLILAPTSVCNNWLEEAQRFAPTLNVRYFGQGDRQQLLDEAGAFDLVVCSYGLLQTESEKLINKPWHTIVADEAQAIKNQNTKRSKAAKALQADFKLVTTGTPIENHLGELWNLFDFINPGLLGSLQKFNERYAQKIENHKDHAVQQRLKKLLQPFILRRLKNDVLTELPARTEVTLHVELSDEERVLYEALRQNAMKTMAASQEQAGAGQQHLKVLAEIMKLRRVCCHPRLVLPESAISSAKLRAFEDLVIELISNHHKALVFSQFVGHLNLLREFLDNKGIHYQYLDGSTTMPKRKAAVNAFQSGEGDLFLISLKAGGSGLNLTAADYVIHMDPWWNPAVEDQASDRAHRMGQKRPVTIYRMVAKDTIEDKIVELHAQKRDLANSLLEGGDVSGKISVDDMLTLIRDEDL